MVCAELLVSFLVLILMINVHRSSSQETQQLIEKICRQMEEYGFCSQTFKENLKSPDSDIVALAQITIERATDNATKTLDFVSHFTRLPWSFFQKDYEDVANSESITPRAEDSCQQSINTLPSNQNPLVDRNRQMRILIAMSVVSVQELLHTRVLPPTSI
ncbi:hypothetical protein M0R45_028597 [Rubus argutus]|uniref:Pectinesterase inhibitor domain-containing protein n=1 Tax=Rubus argutus TaxID=59490 RepID=A0AAW1W7T6_RUBAR